MYGMGLHLGRVFLRNAPVATEESWVTEAIEGAEKREATPPKRTIDWGRENAAHLVKQLVERRDHWQATIVTATEELRQVNVVLEGAIQMLDTIERDLENEVADKVLANLAEADLTE